jgi:ribonuclease BN (tRNA processing enzyme)
VTLRLTVVGCAAAWGHGPDAAASCYLVEGGDGTAVVLDLGQGSFARLAALRPPETVAAVLVSHAHADHCVDLIPLRHALRYEVGAPPGTVALHAPASLPGRFDAFTGEAGFLVDLSFTPLEPGTLAIGELRVAVARVAHTAESFAFRVAAEGETSRRGVVYSGDCGDPADLTSLVRAGDTLLAEASFGAGPVPAGVAHLDATGAARAAREGGASRLVLTHLQPGADHGAALGAARAAFDGEVLLARPGLTLEV